MIEAARRLALRVPVSAGLAGMVAIAATERERRRAVTQLERSSAARIEAHVATPALRPPCW